MKLATWAYPSTVTVEAYLGEGAYGPIYGDPVTIRCAVQEGRKLVRDADGNEVVSETSLKMDAADDIPSGSKVTVNGRVTTSLVSKLGDAPLGGLRQRTVMLA